MTDPRPASRQMLITLVLAVMITAAAVPAASAEVIWDYEMYESSDSSESGYCYGKYYYTHEHPCSYICIENITRYPNLAYIAFTVPGDQGRWKADGKKLESGAHEFLYNLGSQNQKTGRIHVSRNTNALGTIVSTQLILFFDNWDIESLTGKQVITTNVRMATGKAGQDGWIAHDTDVWLFCDTWPENPIPIGTKTHVSVAAYAEWVNHINVTKLSDSPAGGYDVVLTRKSATSSAIYPSVITVFKDEDLLYMDNKNDNFAAWFPDADLITVVSSLEGKTYRFPLTAEPGDTPGGTPGGLSLTLSPATATVNSPVTATLTATAETPRYSEITYAITDPAGNVEYETYSKSQDDWTTWLHHNKTSWLLDPSSEPAAHNPTFTPTSAGTWTVSATIRDQQPPATGAALASVSASCEVSRVAGNVDVAISIYDGAKSSSPLLYGVGVLVEDLTTNGTVIVDTREYRIGGRAGTTNGRLTVSAPLGHQIRTTVEKEGYITQTRTDYVQPTAIPYNQMPISIVLAPATTPAPDQVYLTVLVTDLRSQPIQGATVTAAGKAGTTGAQGTCRLSVPLNQTISWTVTAAGYHGASGIATPLDANSQMTVQLQPTTIPPPSGPGDDPGATPPPGPTPDRRTNEEKGQAVIDMVADNAEGIGALALICLIMGLLKLMVKW